LVGLQLDIGDFSENELHTVAEVMEDKNEKQQTKLADIRLCYKKAVDFQLQSTLSELDIKFHTFC